MGKKISYGIRIDIPLLHRHDDIPTAHLHVFVNSVVDVESSCFSYFIDTF